MSHCKLMFVALSVMVLSFGCNKKAGNQSSAASDPKTPAAKKAAEKPKGAAYKLTVQPPAEGKVGAELAPMIQVLPRGEYKINLEFPHWLKVTAPEGATPAKVHLTSKQAAKMTEAELTFKPGFKMSAAGSHTFNGTIRLGVCDKEKCIFKKEKVQWIAKVTE